MFMYSMFVNSFYACRCLYCDEISLEADTVLSTLYAAKKYIIPHLACACVEYLESNLDASNACVLLSQCRLFEEPDLVRRCWDVINTHTEEVLQSDGFSDMDYQTLEQILGRDSLDVKETEVFAAAARWAEAECTRQGRDTSPQQCREVLGDALYLLRFPTMTPRDFADGAGSSGLLSMQETYDVLFYLTATNKPKVPFPTSCRKKRHKRCLRFTCIVKDNKGWGYSGRWDSIQFSVDKCISVVGFGLYGSRESSVEYPVTIELKQGGRQLLRKTHTIFCDGSSDTFDVLFDSPFQIQANTYYTASLYLKNAKSSHYGTQGMSSVSCDGVNFNFNEYTDVLLVSQNNGTRVNSGQIPEILYYCWADPPIWQMCNINDIGCQHCLSNLHMRIFLCHRAISWHIEPSVCMRKTSMTKLQCSRKCPVLFLGRIIQIYMCQGR